MVMKLSVPVWWVTLWVGLELGMVAVCARVVAAQEDAIGVTQCFILHRAAFAVLLLRTSPKRVEGLHCATQPN